VFTLRGLQVSGEDKHINTAQCSVGRAVLPLDFSELEGPSVHLKILSGEEN
jgi:hypothetical protein